MEAINPFSMELLYKTFASIVAPDQRATEIAC